MTLLTASYYEMRRSNLVKFLRFEHDHVLAENIAHMTLLDYIKQYDR